MENQGIQDPLVNGENQDLQQLQQQQLQQAMTQLVQQQMINLLAMQEQPRNSVCGALCKLIFQLVFAVVFSLTFGILLYLYSQNDEYSDYCDHQTLKNWAYACSIICFVHSGIQTIKSIDAICCTTVYNPKGYCSDYTTFFESLSSGGLFACAIGLTIEDQGDCGSLHKTAMAFYIMMYTLSGIGFIVLCCVLTQLKRGRA